MDANINNKIISLLDDSDEIIILLHTCNNVTGNFNLVIYKSNFE